MLCHRPAKHVIVLIVLAGIAYPATAQVRVQRTVPKHVSEQDLAKRLSHIDSLRNAIGEGESLAEPVARELLEVLADPTEDAFVRGAALGLLCEKGDIGTSERVINIMSSLVSKLRSVRERPDRESYATPGLLMEFLSKDAQALSSRVGNQAPLLDFYARILEDRLIRFEYIYAASYERIADNPASLADRQACMLRVLKVRPGSWPPEVFYALVNDDVLGALRRMAFEGPLGRKGYHAGAMRLLAEFGDMETATKFKDWAAARGHDEDSTNRVGGYVWMIEAQHNTEMLLQQIRSAEWLGGDTHWWSLKQAIRHGVPANEIRSALVEHATVAGVDRRLLSGLIYMKTIAKEHGIIQSTDLQDVPNEERSVHGWGWIRKSRTDPQMLLGHIRSTEHIDGIVRPAVLKQAIGLGLPTERIREALLAHAKAVGSDGRLLNDLIRMKKIASEHGILQPGDLQDVPN